jgi:myosin heavy subunit
VANYNAMEIENDSRKHTGTRIGLIVTILLLLGSVTFLIVEKERRKMAEEGLRTERLKSESLLAEKLVVEKEKDEYKTNLEKMTASSNALHARSKDTEALLVQALRDLDKNEKAKRNVEQLKQQLQKVQNEKSELDRQIADYKNTVDYARGNEEQNKATIAALEMANKQLLAQVEALKKMSMDNSLVQTCRKNQKLSIKARRIKHLSVEADIFGSMDNVTISLSGPDGKAFSPDISELTISPASSTTERGHAFYESGSAESALAKTRVEIIYKPKNKLKPGLYKIFVENNGNRVGSLQVKLI